MGTAVLRPHDCLKHRLHLDFFDSRPPPPTAMNSSRKKPSRSPPAKQSRTVRPRPNPPRSNRRFGSPDKENTGGQPETRKQPPLLMGQVTILKRGEELKTKNGTPPPPLSTAATDVRSGDDESSVLCSTNRLGPDPEILPRFSDLKPVYAGSAVVSSPSPSSLPIPAFFLKKSAGVASKTEATRALLCLLGLGEIA